MSRGANLRRISNCTATFFGFCFAFPLTIAQHASADDFRQATRSSTQLEAQFNTHTRELWTTSRIHGSPDPADRYQTELAFPNIRIPKTLSVCLVPGSNRICLATVDGKIYTFENERQASEVELLVDLGRTIYGVAFHPDFENNGYLFVTNFANSSLNDPTGAHLSRFQVESASSTRARLDSEEVILTWPSGGHNGGCIRFGPEGFLYLSTGDGSGIADALLTGQDIGDLSGSILRIDVDQASESQKYSIPSDNPFVNTEGARGEIWSYGHRHVWKFSFDKQHRLWAGDVGQDLWEAVFLVKRGGNYGWSIEEGGHPFRPDRPHGPTTIEKPIVAHPHSHFRSVTGGYVSHTQRLPELDGAYIYGDYDTGAIWSIRYENGSVSLHEKLADTQLRIVEFLQDRDGDVLAVDFVSGTIHRLVQAEAEEASPQPFPRLLSETGLFSSTEQHVPAKGLIPYSVNAPLWSDGAEKDRFIAVPGDGTIETDAVYYPHQPDYSDLGWKFPDGTVLVKTFSIALDASRPSERRRLETRILHFRQMPGNDDQYGAQVWNGYTYLWNEEQTDAVLLDDESLDRELTILDPSAPGGERKQVWHFPSRTECALCHTMGSKYVLGVTTLQMNKVHEYGGHQENQLALLERLGVLSEPLADEPSKLPALADYHNTSQPLHLRARAYLHANCAHCHRKWGGGNADFELQASVALRDTGTVNTLPGQGTFGIEDPRILVPGQPERSLIWTRMLLQDHGRMPYAGSTVADHSAISMLQEWISSTRDEKQLELPGAIRPRLPNQSNQWTQWYSRLNSIVLMLAAALTFLLWWNLGGSRRDPLADVPSVGKN